MKKFLFFMLVICILFIVGGIMVADFVLEKVSTKALEYLVVEGKSRGINVDFARFGEVGLNGWRAVRWKKFAVVINAPRYIALDPGEDIVLSIEKIDLGLPRLLKGVAAVTASGIVVRVEGGSTPAGTSDKHQEGLDQGRLKVEVPFDVTAKGIATTVSDMPKKALQFLQAGKTQTPFDFRAKSTFRINGSVMRADVTTQEEDGYYFLVMSPDDVRRITALLKEDLTRGEIQLLSRHPLLAPALFKIRNHARVQSEAAYAKDTTVPEDAYRHVLWSFLLTKQFGPEFARQVTDVHEIGAVKPNTEADHTMDYNNNKVGRDYAKAGYAEDVLLELVMTDPQVIRGPSQ